MSNSLSRSRSRRDRRRRRSKSRSRDRSRSSKHYRRRVKRRRRRRSHRDSRSPSRSRSYSHRRRRSRRSPSLSSSSSSSESVNSEAGLTPAQIEEKHELERLTRDARSVFVSQLQVKVTERDIKKFFQRVCKVKDVRLLRDRFTQKSKGYGYVELASLDDIPLALELNEQKFIFPNGKEGFPLKVKPSEAEKNFTHHLEKKNNIGTATYSSQHLQSKRRQLLRRNPILREAWEDKIEIKQLHYNVRENQIEQICQEFGKVVKVDLVRDGKGKSLGQCFIQFKYREDARRAMNKLHGLELAGSRLKVFKMQKGQISKLEGTSLKEVNRRAGLPADSEVLSGSGFNVQTWRLEADSVDEGRYGGTGVAINSAQKMELMSKLGGGVGSKLLKEQQQRAVAAPMPHTTSKTTVGVITGVASRCLLLKNMFDPSEETEEDWDKQIEVETKEEVKKFGPVVHCFVDKNSSGHIYLCLEQASDAVDCAKALHGRYYAKRLIRVEYLKYETYKKKFNNLG